MSSANIRAPAVAGLFYPAAREELRGLIRGYLRHGARQTATPLAIVSPHAGYPYSGATAGVAWSAAARREQPVRRILLLGPSHRVPLRGIATSPATEWRTPLGRIHLDHRGAEQLQLLDFVRAVASAHEKEHCLEVQVPFIQELFPDALLLPLVVGEASAAEVATVLRRYWDDPDTLIAVSSDLSHYHSYQSARKLDRATSTAIEHLDWQSIGPEQACGCRALCGLLKLAQEEHLQVSTLDLCNSGDTAGDKARVVGYGAYVIH